MVTKVLTSRVLISSGDGRFGLFGGVFDDWLTLPGQIGRMSRDEYPFLAELSVPDRLRLAAYEAQECGVSAIHLRAILDAAEGLENTGP